MTATRLTALCLALALGTSAKATPITYDLDAAASKIAFAADFGQDQITGQIPPDTAELTLDFEQVQNCKIAVSLDVRKARANIPFAAEALKSAAVLDAQAHPRMTFHSTKVRPTPNGAEVTGMLMIRGVSKPVILDARLYRPQGSEKGDRRTLTLHLTGDVSRKAFGANGWAELVGDRVHISILARIHARD